MADLIEIWVARRMRRDTARAFAYSVLTYIRRLHPMKLERIKPISYLKANAAEILRELDTEGALIITQNGEAKGVLQDIESYEQTQETLALLKILALGQRQVAEGRTRPAKEAIQRLREELAEKYGTE